MTKMPEQISITIDNSSALYVPGELLEKANDKIDDLRRKLAKAITTINEHTNKHAIPLAGGTLALDLDNPLADGLELSGLEKPTLIATIHREHKMRLLLEAQIPELTKRVQHLENISARY